MAALPTVRPVRSVRANLQGMRENIGPEIAARAYELGADLVGFVSSRKLRDSPSPYIEAARSASVEREAGRQGATVDSPYDLGDQWSAVVIALSHPADRPELDWFTSSGNTPGNAALMRITRELASWLEGALNCRTVPLHYFVEKGGIYLKDAAVHAGLGCIGRNNLLVTPEYGPRVRLRALMVNAILEGGARSYFDPCLECDERCRNVCPQTAFGDDSDGALHVDGDGLPGRDGSYVRARCLVQIDSEWAALESRPQAGMTSGMDDADTAIQAQRVVKHCRRCEFACPVGSQL